MADDERQAARWFMLGSPLIIFVLGFVQLYLTYRVARLIDPDLLGEVAARPAAFAALATLVALPMHVLLWLVLARNVLRAVLAGTEPPDAPVRTGWRRLGAYLLGVLPDLAASMIVFEVITDPGAPHVTVLTVLGPIALYWSLRGLGALGRRAWRRRSGRHPRKPVTHGDP